MNLDAKELYQFLRSKGVRYLYHVSTVATSCGIHSTSTSLPLLLRGQIGLFPHSLKPDPLW
jgi:hypothetical protein